VAVDGRADAGDALEAMRRAGLRRVDLVVVGSSSAKARAAGAAIARRYLPPIVLVAATDTDAPSGAVVVRAPTEVRVGTMSFTVTPSDSGLRMTPTGASARGPPV
jgi:RNA:NAD 2'-phosphotransferase (TPT1/KptA family)